MDIQLSLFDWIPVSERYPKKSGMYTVKDRIGRVYRCWFERTICGFDMTAFGKMYPSYAIVEWKYGGD